MRWCGLDCGAGPGLGGLPGGLRPLGTGDRPLLLGDAEDPWVLLVRWRVPAEFDPVELTEVDDPAASARTYGGWKGPAPRQSAPGED